MATITIRNISDELMARIKRSDGTKGGFDGARSP